MLTPMLRATRSVAYRIARSWRRNPYFRHGGHAKRRWRAESALGKAMPRLVTIAQQMPTLGRLATRARELHAALMADHPANWTLMDRTTGKLVLPAREVGSAERWLLALRRLERLIRGMMTKRSSWIAHRINTFRDRQSDHRDYYRQRDSVLGRPLVRRADDEIARYMAHERRREAVASPA